MDYTSETWRQLATRMIEAHEPQPPELEGISIEEISGGPYCGDYRVVGLCKTCNQVVTHILSPDASGDELHRACHCQCRQHSSEGYRLPHVSGGGNLFAGSPVFTADVMNAEGIGFDPFGRGAV